MRARARHCLERFFCRVADFLIECAPYGSYADDRRSPAFARARSSSLLRQRPPTFDAARARAPRRLPLAGRSNDAATDMHASASRVLGRWLVASGERRAAALERFFAAVGAARSAARRARIAPFSRALVAATLALVALMRLRANERAKERASDR